MALKFQVDSLEDLPEPIRGEYVERDGKYVLATEGEFPGVTVIQKQAEAKFRERNIAQAKELETLKNQLKNYDGIDPVEVSGMKTRLAELERLTGSNDPKSVATLIQSQVAAAIAPYEQKERERTEREARLAERLARKNVESALRDAASKAGVDEVALPDFLHRGLEVFTFEEERVVAKDKDGSPVFSRMQPGTEMSPEEWAFGLADQAPHLFRASHGGGAPGGSGEPAERGGNVRWVDGSNPLEVGKNLEDLATGRARVAGRK